MKMALLLALLLMAYGAHVERAGFVYEDRAWTQDRGLTVRPLMAASMLMARTYPQVHHALSLALHALVVALVGLLAYRIGVSQLGAWFTAALFALLPVNTQAVAYVAARPELFASIGVLGACLAATWRSAYRWPLGALALLFGLAGKETAVVALALVPLTLWHMGDKPAAKYAALVALFLALGGVDAYGGVQAVARMGETPQWQTTWDAWLLTQSAASHRLLSLFVWPAALTVDPDLDILTTGQQALGFVTLALMAAVAYTQRHTRPLVTFGLTWTLISLTPRFLVQTPRSALNEHQGYLAMIGLTLAAGSLWDTWQQKATA